nr:hypothetical protein [Tanacetum cinerariifolium]
MSLFGYRLNPRYAIKECSSCGTLYTRDCVCSKGNVEDKILVPKLPKNCARYARCSHPVDGPYCQGCALLRQELERNLVTHSHDFQNTSESLNDSTNVVNAPREPFQEEKQLEEEQAAKAQNWKLPVCYDDDNDEERSNSLKDNIIFGLPSYSASPPDSELVGSEVMEIVILEVGGIDDDILLTIKDDILREKLLNVDLLIAKIEALNDNPTPTFDCKTKSSSTSLNSLLEENNTFDNSLPKFETFCFDVKEIKISSGRPTTHSDSSLYASFIFDLSINPFLPADRSDFYEFADELIPFISPPEYDCFLFKVEPNSSDFTKDVVKDIYLTKESQVHNALPTHPTLQFNLKFQPSSEYLFTYVVWIFLPFLVYSVASHYLLSLRNKDTIFDPGICNSHFSRPDVSHRCGTFLRFKVLPESTMEIFSSTCSPMEK